MTPIRKKAVNGISIGDRFMITRTFTEADVSRFADITRDYNPVHFENRFAKVKHFKANICHGLLVASMVTEVGGQIGWLATEMNFQFVKPVYFGDTISCELTVTAIDKKGFATASTEFRNKDNEIVLIAALKGFLPGDAEKEVLTQMMAKGDPTNGLSKG